MIRKLVRQMLAAQILSALTVSLCLLIDNIMIGRYLGVGAIAAYGLANPVLLVIGAVGSLLCAGAQVACSKSLGRGSQEETNVGYSSAIAVAAVFSIVFTAAVLVFRVPLARAMGANTDELLYDTSRYMAGFIVGAPASMAALMLVPFLQMAGKSSLLIAAVLGMTVGDVALDLLNVLVFHGGMFGMGIASSASYYIAMLIGGSYFVSKKCVFRFSRSRIRRDKIRELIAGGVPTMFGMVSTVVLVFLVNRLLLPVGGGAAVAAFSVINTILNASNCISTGTGGVSLTLSGILYHEEDRTGLRTLMKLLVKSAVILGAAVAVLLIAFAPTLVGVFIAEDGASRHMAVTGLRLFALGLIPCCVNNALKNSYQGVGHVRTMEIISVLENAALPVLAAYVLSLSGRVNDVWLYYLIGEVLTLTGILAAAWIRRGGVTWKTEDILRLSDRFGVPPEDLLEADLSDVDGVMAFSRQAEAFCQAHGGSARLAGHLALCIEEMGGNIVTHGFEPGRNNHLTVRLQTRDGHWTLSFRDDCRGFDPLSHMERASQEDSLGIRLVMRMADEARYTYSLNLNNLTLTLRDRVPEHA